MPVRFRFLAAMPLAVWSVSEAAFPTCNFVDHAIDTGTDNVGYVRIAAHADGRPLLVYTIDIQNASTLNLFDCDDATCATGQLIPLDASTNYFGSPDIVMRTDGRPALTAIWHGGVRYYDCQNTACTSFVYNDIVPMASGISSDLPMALQPNGNPAFLYVDANLFMSPRPDISSCTFATMPVAPPAPKRRSPRRRRIRCCRARRSRSTPTASSPRPICKAWVHRTRTLTTSRAAPTQRARASRTIRFPR
jgi:hypothetical protein